mgnify:CR=1 FL=1
MKKLSIFLGVVLLAAVTVTSVFAIDTRANIRADFYVFQERNNPDATGYAILNYVKGQGTWNISGEVYNMRPDTYTLSVGTGGQCDDNNELLDFTVGEDGYASFKMTGASLQSDIDIARIYKKGNACITELTAPAGDGSLSFRGSGRVFDNGKWHD